MLKSIYVVCPASDFPTYFGADVLAGNGFRPAAYMGDLAIVTVASMARAAGLEVRLCDENISPVDLDCDADCIGLTGKVNQRSRMFALAREFRRRGKPVLIGGPYASLSPEEVRPHCDILVRGEIEEIAPQIFGDLRNDTWKDEYVADRPNSIDGLLPSWRMYPNGQAMQATVQTSRGCPFECDFCDVIQYLGRKQRHKSIGAVLAELDLIYDVGYRSVFLSDDNFTVHRSRCKELLEALKTWNDARPDKVAFYTQSSIDAARDEELLRMCAEAGLGWVFIGIETPNEESLRESKKRQNLRINLAEQIDRYLEHGIVVTAGMIVGFDGDTSAIFQRQLDFAEAANVPIFGLGALVAPAATPLHDRMVREGRIVGQSSEEVIGLPWDTNIAPLRMSREELLHGLKWLCNRLYDPEVFTDRVLRFIHALRAPTVNRGLTRRPVDMDIRGLLAKFPSSGPAEQRLWSTISAALAKKPAASRAVGGVLFAYMQVRYMYDRGQLWEPMVAASGPVLQAPRTARSLPLLT
jgi:radical SAM superfamily enzyme YgiQ (UPF0313 family)